MPRATSAEAAGVVASGATASRSGSGPGGGWPCLLEEEADAFQVDRLFRSPSRAVGQQRRQELPVGADRRLRPQVLVLDHEPPRELVTKQPVVSSSLTGMRWIAIVRLSRIV